VSVEVQADDDLDAYYDNLEAQLLRIATRAARKAERVVNPGWLRRLRKRLRG
jgi:hypothetical protein